MSWLDSIVVLSTWSLRFFLGWEGVGFRMIASAGVNNCCSQSTGSYEIYENNLVYKNEILLKYTL